MANPMFSTQAYNKIDATKWDKKPYQLNQCDMQCILSQGIQCSKQPFTYVPPLKSAETILFLKPIKLIWLTNMIKFTFVLQLCWIELWVMQWTNPAQRLDKYSYPPWPDHCRSPRNMIFQWIRRFSVFFTQNSFSLTMFNIPENSDFSVFQCFGTANHITQRIL